MFNGSLCRKEKLDLIDHSVLSPLVKTPSILFSYLSRYGEEIVKGDLLGVQSEEGEQAAIAHVLGDDVEGLHVRAHRVHRNEVRMRELLHDFRLLNETRGGSKQPQ